MFVFTGACKNLEFPLNSEFRVTPTPYAMRMEKTGERGWGH